MSLSDLVYTTETPTAHTAKFVDLLVAQPHAPFEAYHPFDVYDTDDDRLYDLVETARAAALRAIVHVKEVGRNGKPQRTDNYVPDLSDDLNDLTNYVDHANRFRPFMTRNDLPEAVKVRLSKPESDRIIRMLQLHFYHTALLAMTQEHDNDELYYEENRGIWQFRQSTIDCATLRRVHRRILFDRRNFHGLVRKQARDRNVPAGTSIGGLGRTYQARSS